MAPLEEEGLPEGDRPAAAHAPAWVGTEGFPRFVVAEIQSGQGPGPGSGEG